MQESIGDSQLNPQFYELILKLSKSSGLATTIEYLQTIQSILQPITISSLQISSQFLKKYINPIELSAGSVNVKFVTDKKLMIQKLYFKIAQFYIVGLKQFLLEDGLKMLRQLLSRSTSIFNNSLVTRIYYTSEDQKITADELKKSIWIKNYTNLQVNRTPFYYKCCNQTILELEGLQQLFSQTNIKYAEQYFLLISEMEKPIKQQKIMQMFMAGVSKLQQIFNNLGQFQYLTKNISFEGSVNLLKAINIGIKQNYNIEACKRVQFIFSRYALSLILNHSIEKNLEGFKLLNRWVKYLSVNIQLITQQEYYKWLTDHKIITLILESENNLVAIKVCKDIIKFFIGMQYLGVENSDQIFDFLKYKATSQVRQLLFGYMNIQPSEDSSDYKKFIMKKFSEIQNADFYQEEIFIFIQRYLRFCNHEDSQKVVLFLEQLVKCNWQHFRNDSIQSKCYTCLVKAITNVIQKNPDKDDKLSYILKIYGTYMTEPSYLGIRIINNIFDSFPTMDYPFRNTVALNIIKQSFILSSGIDLIETKLSFHEELEQLICTLLDFASNSSEGRLKFEQQYFFNATKCPKIFNKMLQYVEDPYILFENLVSKFEIEAFPFACLKNCFYRLNNQYFKKVNKPYAQNQYQLSATIDDLKGYELINYLLLNVDKSEIRNQIADFISDLYTTYKEQFSKQGEQQLISAMKKIQKLTIQAYQNQENQSKILLAQFAIIEYLMGSTERRGVGGLRAHNSLISTSTVRVRILNSITNFPAPSQLDLTLASNLTIFQLIEKVSKGFKCCPSEIMFRENGITLPDKINGLTLQEAQFDGKIVSAVKSYRQYIRRQQLLISGKLAPKAKVAFENIFNTFAKQGKMGKKQYANYVQITTNTFCSEKNQKVENFFKVWDTNKDDYIYLDDFLRSYQTNCNQKKRETIWKTLQLMKFRKNLKKYDQPIDPPTNQLLFRYYLSQNNQMYHLLLNLSKSSDQQLRNRSVRILFRLPTNKFILTSLTEKIDFTVMNQFQIQYYLILIIHRLLNHQNPLQAIQKFTDSGNIQSIFQILQMIAEKKNTQKNQMRCFTIALKILRVISKVPDLKSKIQKNVDLSNLVQLPKTDIFLKLINNYRQREYQTLQSALALQITQSNNDIETIIRDVFHEQNQIRIMACNYIFICLKMGKITINPFDIEIKIERNCEDWFRVLSMIIQVNDSLDYQNILINSLNKITLRSESVQKNPQDPIIFGYLCVIINIIELRKVRVPEIFGDQIFNLAGKLLSVKNRTMIYHLLATQNLQKSVNYAIQLLDSVTPRTKISKKKLFVGIKNFSNICYMNSTLQMLYKIQEFRSFVFSLDNSKQLEKTQIEGVVFYDNLIYQLQKMYSYLEVSIRKYYQPNQFCLTIKDPYTKLPINPKIQEDAHEFLAKFFQSLQKQLKQSPKFDDLKKIFFGKTRTQFVCQQCLGKITKQQNFSQINLQVKNIEHIQQSFQKYIQKQFIHDYFCEPCNKKVDRIQKSTHLSELPQILIINLMRIIYDLYKDKQIKVDSNFKFSTYLDISDYVSKPYIDNVSQQNYSYILKGIIIHSGTSQSGHYYSLIKDEDEWYKFNDEDVTKIDDFREEAFGGPQAQNQQWNDQYPSSTNAYILFYQKQQKSKKLNIQTNPTFKKEIQIDNKLLFNQLQVHQQSIFTFPINLYEKYRPENIQDKINKQQFNKNSQEDPSAPIYQMIYSLMVKLLKFLKTFCGIRIDLVQKIGTYLSQIFYLIPQKTKTFLNQLDFKDCVQVLCEKSNERMQIMYSILIPKALYIYSKIYGLSINNVSNISLENNNILMLLENLYMYMVEDKTNTKIYQLAKYFEFWKVCAELVPQIQQFLLQKQTIVVLVDLLMANDSYLARSKDRIEIPYFLAIPITQLLSILLSNRKNLVDYINPNFESLARSMINQQKRMLGNINFYDKMIQNHSDNQHLALITSKLAEQDYKFSQKLAEMFLKYLNSSNNQLQSSLLMLNHLREYLLIDDQYTENRIKWMLGIPQLKMENGMNFGVELYNQFYVHNYLSTLYFGNKQYYQPLLHVLFLRRQNYTQFSISLIALLLQLMYKSQKILNYMVRIPSPSYIFKSYLDWMQNYIRKFKQQVNYDLEFDKNIIESVVQLYKRIQLKIQDYEVSLPVNKFIIGINKQCKIISQLNNPEYKIILRSHHTYVLDNVPIASMNVYLPKNTFGITDPTDQSKYFIIRQKMKQFPKNQAISSLHTLYSLCIDSKKDIKIKFKFPKFNEQVYFPHGKIYINFPYQQLPQEIKIEDRIEISISQRYMDEYPQLFNHSRDMQQEMIPKSSKNEQEIICQKCTFINPIANKCCEMCNQQFF